MTALLPELNKEMEKINNLFQRPPRPASSSSAPAKAGDDD
jgi:hypothetical protein